MSPGVAAGVVKMLAKLTKPAAEPVSLSPREHDLLKLLVEGLTAKEIADRMQVSIHTTSTHTRNLFTKLNVHSRAAAVARAPKDRLVCSDSFTCFAMICIQSGRESQAFISPTPQVFMASSKGLGLGLACHWGGC